MQVTDGSILSCFALYYVLVNHPPLPVSQHLSLPEPVKDTVGVDRVRAAIYYM